jgi:hypothetical protein
MSTDDRENQQRNHTQKQPTTAQRTCITEKGEHHIPQELRSTGEEEKRRRRAHRGRDTQEH